MQSKLFLLLAMTVTLSCTEEVSYEVMHRESWAYECAHGGTKTEFGLDNDGNGKLNDDEVNTKATSVVCSTPVEVPMYGTYAECYSDTDCAWSYPSEQYCDGNVVITNGARCQYGQCVTTSQTETDYCEFGCNNGSCLSDPLIQASLWVTYTVPTSLVADYGPQFLSLELQCYNQGYSLGFVYSADVYQDFDSSANNQELRWETNADWDNQLRKLSSCSAVAFFYDFYMNKVAVTGGFLSVGVNTPNLVEGFRPSFNLCHQNDNLDDYWFNLNWDSRHVEQDCQ